MNPILGERQRSGKADDDERNGSDPVHGKTGADYPDIVAQP